MQCHADDARQQNGPYSPGLLAQRPGPGRNSVVNTRPKPVNYTQMRSCFIHFLTAFLYLYSRSNSIFFYDSCSSRKHINNRALLKMLQGLYSWIVRTVKKPLSYHTTKFCTVFHDNKLVVIVIPSKHNTWIRPIILKCTERSYKSNV